MVAKHRGELSVSRKIEGKIVAITPEGNLVSDIAADRLSSAPRDTSVVVRCDEHETRGIFGVDHQEPPFTLLALLGGHETLELTIVGDSAKIMLGVGLGTPVTVEW